ncbi:MAG: hypothetical protein FWD13_12515, partial [Treponema sp.]|nr:hypothetical protein [Treponema sp.]
MRVKHFLICICLVMAIHVMGIAAYGIETESSHNISFSAELLIEEYFSDELEIAIEPENIEKRQELEDIFEEIGITT